MSQTLKIIYLRVSKQDLDSGKTEQQVLEDQLPPILKKFNLKENECLILKEKGSAYNIDKLKDRTEFLKILDYCFNAETTTIKDLFIGNYVKDSNIELYVFDSNRLMRNIEFGMLFAILRSLFEIKLFSVNQDNLNINESDLIGVRMSKYMMGTIDSYLAEGYSQNISDAVKKAFHKKDGISISRDGNKIGRYFTDSTGKKTKVSPNRIISMRKRIIELNKSYDQDKIISLINSEFNVLVSKSYIGKVLKNGNI